MSSVFAWTDDDSTDSRTKPGSLRAASGAEELLYGEDLGIGARVGRYVIEDRIGRGGFARIYRARHRIIGRTSAIKLLHRRLATSSKIVERFIQEARVANMIAHPNIVDIYGIDELADGRPYLVMEWIDGNNLEQELRARGRFAPNEALPLLEGIVSALRAVHAAGVVHRDLKASNVLTKACGALKLVDFGIAKVVGEREDDAGPTDARLGSPTNMAPEQLLDQPIDVRTDIYAFGVLTYQLVSGRLPFNAPTVAELEELHLHAPAPRTDVSTAIDAVIQRCMEKSPANRFQTVDQLSIPLRHALSGRRTSLA